MSQTDRAFVALTITAGERHIHSPLRKIRYDMSDCLCGAVIRERYGAWRELTRYEYWKFRRYWRMT